ncbi:MAG: DNA gyrase subunit B [Armatimonadetes bacterium]|nr:DNA gyrase subunit B [Armatimonadota bacterium]
MANPENLFGGSPDDKDKPEVINPNEAHEDNTSHAAVDDETIAGRVETAYDESSITVLEGLEAVRKRPGMYVGDNGKKGLHQMFREVIDNGVDEALAGHCDSIKVTLHEDNSISHTDNGRGIPVGIHEKMGISTLTVVMTVLHAGGKFGEGGGYKVSGGLHGVGVSCTNALSEWMYTTVQREGKIYQQKFEAGIPVTEVTVIGKCKVEDTGTTQHWLADKSVLTESVYDIHIIKGRMRELAYLNPNVKFEFTNEQNEDDNETFFFQNGIVQLVEDINEAKTAIHKTIYFKRIKDRYEIEIALQYHDGYNYTVLAYSNNIHQPDGGTHVSGFSTAMTRVLNSYGRKMGLIKEKEKNFASDDVGDGLTAAISLKLENPQYNSQDKVKLVTPEVQGVVNSLVGDGLSTFLEENPGIAKKIIEKATIAQRAREEARKAFEAVKRRDSMDSYGLPGKLSDCVSKDPTKCEIFLVEGDSAGGSAKDARDRVTQAILPLRGKILNVERARITKALDNEEIKSLIAALGVGIDIQLGIREPEDDDPMAIKKDKDKTFDITKLRYHKVIIMTDADVDGEHIRTLLLTFFYRYMKPLVMAGYIYLVQPPLFVIKVGASDRYYAADQAQLDEVLKSIGKKKYQISRFKGLGEMNASELEETTMAYDKRRLIRIVYDPQFEMEIEAMFSRLMGEKVEPRREFIEKHAKEALDVDWHY